VPDGGAGDLRRARHAIEAAGVIAVGIVGIGPRTHRPPCAIPLLDQRREAGLWAGVHPDRCAGPAATRLFSERGYQATPMSQIAHAAGVAVQTLHFVFHTKAELLQEAFTTAVLGEAGPPPQQDWYRALEHEHDGRRLIASIVQNISPADAGRLLASQKAPVPITVTTRARQDFLQMHFHAPRHESGATASGRCCTHLGKQHSDRSSARVVDRATSDSASRRP
jgi:AcrR family transcriptional regulator